MASCYPTNKGVKDIPFDSAAKKSPRLVGRGLECAVRGASGGVRVG
jgi:hypothetical protein